MGLEEEKEAHNEAREPPLLLLEAKRAPLPPPPRGQESSPPPSSTSPRVSPIESLVRPLSLEHSRIPTVRPAGPGLRIEEWKGDLSSPRGSLAPAVS